MQKSQQHTKLQKCVLLLNYLFGFRLFVFKGDKGEKGEKGSKGYLGLPGEPGQQVWFFTWGCLQNWIINFNF